MIKLEREGKPEYLSDNKVTELTNAFKVTKKSVWNNNHIKIPLLRSSHYKCAYCECPLASESNYMEVEHFEDKNHNPDKVVLWENLLPSCKRCNGAKGTHDVIDSPIINPYVENPKDHLSMRLYRFRAKTEIGQCTIEVTKLNQSDRSVFSRYEIGEKINEYIDTSWDRWDVYLERRDIRSKNKLMTMIEALLNECQPSSSYSASTATNLLTDSKFIELISLMREEEVLSEDLETLIRSASILVLDCV
jgi:5-methylcytosine-specific restriction endonuclease McrA